MPKISLMRQCVTHFAVAVIAFQLGSVITSTSYSKCLVFDSTSASASASAATPIGRNEDWDLQLNRRRIRNNEAVVGLGSQSGKAPSVSASASASLLSGAKLGTKDFLHGLAWIPRSSFVKDFDTGVAIDNAGAKNSSVLLLYADRKSIPRASSSSNWNHPFVKAMSDPLEATENCDELQILLSSTKRKNRCIAIMENWGGSPHLYRFSRYDKDSKRPPLRLGGRFFDGTGGAGRWQKVSRL